MKTLRRKIQSMTKNKIRVRDSTSVEEAMDDLWDWIEDVQESAEKLEWQIKLSQGTKTVIRR